MNYLGIAENTFAAIASALIIAGGVWLISWIRNVRLEASLKDAINANGVGVSFNPATYEGRFSLQIHNYANAAIRVRSVMLFTDKFHVELLPCNEMPIRQTPLTNEVARPKFKRKHLSRGMLEPDGNPNAMLLPPKTMGFWAVESQTIGAREWVVNDVYMAFEYATIFGNAALVRIRAGKQAKNLIKKNFEDLARAVHRKDSSQIKLWAGRWSSLPNNSLQADVPDGPRPAFKR